MGGGANAPGPPPDGPPDRGAVRQPANRGDATTATTRRSATVGAGGATGTVVTEVVVAVDGIDVLVVLDGGGATGSMVTVAERTIVATPASRASGENCS